MTKRLAFLTVLSVLAAACMLPKSDLADGAACAKDDECKSHRCWEGFCGGSACSLSDASTCADGWKCVHRDADAITGFFGNDGSETCVPTCGHCPGNMHCPKDAPAGAMCTYGKEPFELTVVAENAVVGRTTTLTANASANTTAGRIVHCRWEIGDGKAGEETSGAYLERVFDEARDYWARVSCEDDGGRTAAVESNFTVACSPSGEACVPGKCCADTSMRCISESGGGSPTCRAPQPIMLAITGPTTVSMSTEATYTVEAVSGDGRIETVYWKFTDDIGIPSPAAATTTHRFSKAGWQTITANVTTDIETHGETTLSVMVQ